MLKFVNKKNRKIVKIVLILILTFTKNYQSCKKLSLSIIAKFQNCQTVKRFQNVGQVMFPHQMSGVVLCMSKTKVAQWVSDHWSVSECQGHLLSCLEKKRQPKLVPRGCILKNFGAIASSLKCYCYAIFCFKGCERWELHTVQCTVAQLKWKRGALRSRRSELKEKISTKWRNWHLSSKLHLMWRDFSELHPRRQTITQPVFDDLRFFLEWKFVAKIEFCQIW